MIVWSTVALLYEDLSSIPRTESVVVCDYNHSTEKSKTLVDLFRSLA